MGAITIMARLQPVRIMMPLGAILTLALAAAAFGWTEFHRYDLKIEDAAIETRRIDEKISFALMRLKIANPNDFPVWLRAKRRVATIDGFRYDPGNTVFETMIPARSDGTVPSDNILLDHVSSTIRNGKMDFLLCFGRAKDTLRKGKSVSGDFKILHEAYSAAKWSVGSLKVVDNACN